MIKHVREGTGGHYLAILRGLRGLGCPRGPQGLGVPQYMPNIVKFHDFEWIFEGFAPKTYDNRAISPQLSARAFPRHRGTII